MREKPSEAVLRVRGVGAVAVVTYQQVVYQQNTLLHLVNLMVKVGVV